MTEVLPQFKIVTPDCVEAAIAALAGAPDARACAGGTDIVVALRKGLSETGTLVDLTGIAALRETATGADGGMVIGAGVTLAAIELYTHPELRAAARKEFDEKRGPDYQYKSLLGDRDPPLDYRK